VNEAPGRDRKEFWLKEYRARRVDPVTLYMIKAPMNRAQHRVEKRMEGQLSRRRGNLSWSLVH
jgi:hypothetical protein